MRTGGPVDDDRVLPVVDAVRDVAGAVQQPLGPQGEDEPAEHAVLLIG